MYFLFPLECRGMHLLPVYVMEFCFPYEKNNAKTALDDLLTVINDEKGKDLV